MRIVYTFPTLRVHGGGRIVLEHVQRLKSFGHYTALYIEDGKIIKPMPYEGFDEVEIITDRKELLKSDCIVLGSPHSNWVMDELPKGSNIFLFMQMEESKFRPYDLKWKRECARWYQAKYPLIHGSHWGEEAIKRFGRTSPNFYVGNGVNLDHFPISTKPKSGKYILLESPESPNQAKDVNQIALKVAARLKAEGYKILAYGAQFPKSDVYSEYHQTPSLYKLNDLYDRSQILLKATRYDARALSPMEAMTKGCVTARSIIEGDDDLIHEYNCLRCGYGEEALYLSAKRLLENNSLYLDLQKNCIEYVQQYSWNYWMPRINDILTKKI